MKIVLPLCYFLHVGPAASLFQESYFQLVRQALRPGGIVCSQGENAWFHSHLISPLLKSCTELFPVVDYAYTCIPTYPGGQIGFILCSTNPVSNKPLQVSYAYHNSLFLLPGNKISNPHSQIV